MSSKRKETAQEEEPQENGTPANKRKKTLVRMRPTVRKIGELVYILKINYLTLKLLIRNQYKH